MYERKRLLCLLAMLLSLGNLVVQLHGTEWSVGHQSNATGAHGLVQKFADSFITPPPPAQVALLSMLQCTSACGM